MSRNLMLDGFSMSPSANIERSTFDRNSSYKTTFDAGKLIPFYVDEIYPGDTFSLDTALLCRMATPIFPVMDNAYLDLYYFFVPNRLVWENWEAFNGQADPNAWENPTEYVVPSIDLSADPSDGYDLLDYFGIPTHSLGLAAETINALPFRMYNLIYNEYFRDENLMEPLLIQRGNTDTLDNYKLLPVCKFHDYFTSALPNPQKGGAVTIPGGEGLAPVITGQSFDLGTGFVGMEYQNIDALPFSAGELLGIQGNDTNFGKVVTAGTSSDAQSSYTIVAPSNLYADMSRVTLGTINQLRQAVAVQRLLEKDARGGSRYTELLRQHFGVVSPDSRLQRPEYLGGKRIAININQVIQQSATGTGETPQGNVSGFSKTVDNSSSFTKSFVEHGFIIGVMCVRTDHTYQQGINKLWSRRNRFDYYWPSLANIGEQPIRNKEIYFDGSANDNDGIFGYQEAWADLRYKPSIVTGKFRSSADGTLDAWHYADDYSSRPYLSPEWIQETDANIDRTIAVPSEPQFIIDMLFRCKATRPLPLYSIPGLMDHY